MSKKLRTERTMKTVNPLETINWFPPEVDLIRDEEITFYDKVFSGGKSVVEKATFEEKFVAVKKYPLEEKDTFWREILILQRIK